MRPQVLLGLAMLLVLITPVPALGQDLPVEAPRGVESPDVPVEAPEWVGRYQGAVYYVRDGAVSRLDGAPVQPSAAAEILKAKRASDALDGAPGFLERLADRSSYDTLLLQKLSGAEDAVARLRSIADGLAPVDVDGMSGSFAGQLPINPQDLYAHAAVLEAMLAEVRSQSDEVKAASADAREEADNFIHSHSVEDKVALFGSFARAVPVYEEAASRADDVQARAEDAAAHAESILQRYEAAGAERLWGIALGGAPSGLSDVEAELNSVAGDLGSEAEQLRSDAMLMRAMIAEPVESAFPILWVVGGGGAAASGLGGLWFLRRKLGLP